MSTKDRAGTRRALQCIDRQTLNMLMSPSELRGGPKMGITVSIHPAFLGQFDMLLQFILCNSNEHSLFVWFLGDLGYERARYEAGNVTGKESVIDMCVTYFLLIIHPIWLPVAVMMRAFSRVSLTQFGFRALGTETRVMFSIAFCSLTKKKWTKEEGKWR